MKYLTEEEYEARVKGLHSNWTNYQERWAYHNLTIKWLKELKPESVLEVGSLGVRLTDVSETLDFNDRWKIDQPDITYLHDMRVLPWPVGHYDVVVGLRCFHYCDDSLVDVFNEARRVGDSLILALPEDFDVSALPSAQRVSDRLRTKTLLYLWN